jgi:hypothetical protein
MKFLFDDDTFSFETLRSTSFASYFGADLGEVLATADRIRDGDQGSWYREWRATAGRWPNWASARLLAGTGSPREKTCCGRRTTTAPRLTFCSTTPPTTRKSM